MQVCFVAYTYDCIDYCDAEKTSNHISIDEWTLRLVTKIVSCNPASQAGSINLRKPATKYSNGLLNLRGNTIAKQQFVTAATLKYRPNKHTATTTNGVTELFRTSLPLLSQKTLNA
jgi:hypothetical protein